MRELFTPEEIAQQRKDWYEDVFGNVDLYMSDYCGNWLQGVYSKDGVWLAWESDETLNHYAYVALRDHAIRQYKAGQPLPPNFYVMDATLADKAWNVGKEKFGEGWYGDSESDATTYDIVVQLTLLGEVRYG